MNLNEFLTKYQSLEIETVPGCVEPGYTDKPVILANWNDISKEDFQAMEAKGFSCEWHDEWVVCGNCGKAFRSSPNGHGWQMYGAIVNGEYVCGECMDMGEYLESIENNPRHALTASLLRKADSLDKYGYELVKDGFENGLHPHQNDNPQKILADALRRDPSGRYVFVMDGQGQFEIDFALYKKVGLPEDDSDEPEYATFDRFHITLTRGQARSASHAGDCHDDVMALLNDERIKAHLDTISPDDIRAELKESGGWDDDELKDDEVNRSRIVWIAACNITEELKSDN